MIVREAFKNGVEAICKSQIQQKKSAPFNLNQHDEVELTQYYLFVEVHLFFTNTVYDCIITVKFL